MFGFSDGSEKTKTIIGGKEVEYINTLLKK